MYTLQVGKQFVHLSPQGENKCRLNIGCSKQASLGGENAAHTYSLSILEHHHPNSCNCIASDSKHFSPSGHSSLAISLFF